MTNITRYNPTDVNDLMRLGAVLAKAVCSQTPARKRRRS
jgi:hypothetical protein